MAQYEDDFGVHLKIIALRCVPLFSKLSRFDWIFDQTSPWGRSFSSRYNQGHDTDCLKITSVVFAALKLRLSNKGTAGYEKICLLTKVYSRLGSRT